MAISRSTIAAVVLASLPFLPVTGATDARAATFLVTTTSTNGVGSLRQAILDANANADLDTIAFAIPGIGVLTIGGSLPTITKPVIIDGYTQPTSSVNTAVDGTTNAVLRVRLDGATAKTGDAVLTITSGQTTIRGIVINNIKATGSAILITEHAKNVAVRGCFIGTSPTGFSDSTHGDGIVVEWHLGRPHVAPGGVAGAPREDGLHHRDVVLVDLRAVLEPLEPGSGLGFALGLEDGRHDGLEIGPTG